MIREPGPGDIPLITSSWKQSYLDITEQCPKGLLCLGLMDRVTYFEAQERIIRSLWKHSNTALAVHPEFPDQVYGWICWTPPNVLHYAYTRQPWRRLHVATRLLQHAFPGFPNDQLQYTHHTHHMKYRAPAWRAVYNPYLLYELLTHEADDPRR